MRYSVLALLTVRRHPARSKSCPCGYFGTLLYVVTRPDAPRERKKAAWCDAGMPASVQKEETQRGIPTTTTTTAKKGDQAGSAAANVLSYSADLYRVHGQVRTGVDERTSAHWKTEDQLTGGWQARAR